MGFLDDNGVLYYWQKIKGIFATKDELDKSKVTVTDNLTSTSATDALSAKQGNELNKKIEAINTNMENLGGGDMLKSRYDVDNDGQVDKADDADNLGGQSPSYYAKSEDLNALQSEVNALSESAEAIVEELTAVAEGKCKSYTFDTVSALDTWLEDEENTSKLKTGDVFYIRAVDVPDYWWDADTGSKQILETQKVEIPTISNAEIDAILAT